MESTRARVSLRPDPIGASTGAGRLASILASAARVRTSTDFWPRGSFSATVGSVFVCLGSVSLLASFTPSGELRGGSVSILLRHSAPLVDRSSRNGGRGRLGAAALGDLASDRSDRRGSWRGRGEQNPPEMR